MKEKKSINFEAQFKLLYGETLRFIIDIDI